MSGHKFTTEEMIEGFELLASYSRLIAQLPLEDWERALDIAETVAPVTDPTLYREYLYSDRAKVLRSLLAAAIPLKAAVLDAQPACVREMEREREKGRC